MMATSIRCQRSLHPSVCAFVDHLVTVIDEAMATPKTAPTS